jgi:hypothetical protein
MVEGIASLAAGGAGISEVPAFISGSPVPNHSTFFCM